MAKPYAAQNTMLSEQDMSFTGKNIRSSQGAVKAASAAAPTIKNLLSRPVEGDSKKATEPTELGAILQDDKAAANVVTARQKIMEQLTSALNTSNKDTQKKLEEKTVTVLDLLVKDPTQTTAWGMAANLAEIKYEGKTEYEAGHKKQNADLDTLIATPEFKVLMTEAGVTEDHIKAFSADLKEKQQAQVQTFEKAINPDIERYTAELRAETAKLELFQRAENNSKMSNTKKALDKYLADLDQNAASLGSKKSALSKMSASDIEKIENLKSSSGFDLTQEKNGAYKIKIRPSWTQALSYIGKSMIQDDPLMGLRESTKQDLRDLVRAVQMADPTKNGIEFEINYKDQNAAEEASRMAIEAALEAGCDPSNIDVICNGKKYTLEDKENSFAKLFEKDPERLATAKAKGQETKAQYEQIVKDRAGEARGKLQELRDNDAKAKAAAQQQQQPQPQPGAGGSVPNVN